MEMGPLLETQLSADTGEGTEGSKEKQRKIIEFYVLFFIMPPPYSFLSQYAG